MANDLRESEARVLVLEGALERHRGRWAIDIARGRHEECDLCKALSSNPRHGEKL